jgi:hypothetical protein
VRYLILKSTPGYCYESKLNSDILNNRECSIKHRYTVNYRESVIEWWIHIQDGYQSRLAPLAARRLEDSYLLGNLVDGLYNLLYYTADTEH